MHTAMVREHARTAHHAAVQSPNPGSVDGEEVGRPGRLMIYVGSSYVELESCRRIESWANADAE
jgi:hypothetical protein